MIRPSGTSVIFFAIICSLALNFALEADSSRVCKTDEGRVVCLREWINSGSSILAVVAASIAALFTAQQLKLIRSQTSHTAIPNVEVRIQEANKCRTRLVHLQQEVRRLHMLIGDYEASRSIPSTGIKNLAEVSRRVLDAYRLLQDAIDSTIDREIVLILTNEIGDVSSYVGEVGMLYNSMIKGPSNNILLLLAIELPFFLLKSIAALQVIDGHVAAITEIRTRLWNARDSLHRQGTSA